MKNKMLFIILFSILLIIPITTFALDYPDINSQIVEIYDLDDKKILYEIKSNEVASIASLTKIATTITAIENIKDLDEKVTITNSILETVSWEASIAGLKEGDVLTYRDLLYASMLPSGADATNSLAILSSGNIANFVNKMNELATRIGLENTHFVNVTGLDIKGHYSTANDIIKLLEYSLKNPLFKEIYTTKKYTMTNGKTVKSTLYHYNNTNINIDKIIGSKTGFTLNAGYCLSSLSNINGHEILIIVLNAEQKNNKYYNIYDTVELIDFLNENFKEQILVKKGTIIKEIPVKLSQIEKYNIYAEEIKKYLPSDYDINKLKINYEGLEELSFKNKKGDKIGNIKYYYNNLLISKQDIILNKKLKISFRKIIIKYFYIVIILIILIIYLLFKNKKK